MDDALRMKDEMLGLGLEMNLFICNSIINGYCKLGKVHEAEGLVISMSSWKLKPDSYTYNTLLDGLCQRCAFADALQLWHLLLKRGVALNEVSYGIILDGMGKITEVEEILEKMKELDYSLDGISYRTLSDGYLEAITRERNCAFSAPSAPNRKEKNKISSSCFSASGIHLCAGKGSIHLSKTVMYGYTAAGLEGEGGLARLPVVSKFHHFSRRSRSECPCGKCLGGSRVCLAQPTTSPPSPVHVHIDFLHQTTRRFYNRPYHDNLRRRPQLIAIRRPPPAKTSICIPAHSFESYLTTSHRIVSRVLANLLIQPSFLDRVADGVVTRARRFIDLVPNMGRRVIPVRVEVRTVRVHARDEIECVRG
ncbi:hypothetical protein RHSIM_Rhsim12G0060500 [Rhododendron simsii]|uniref:Pentatricopeptide repeat-containing protein n=1 Tax=Rhododendron simsii TaxID=118357 RepID=A0A834G570_RHOSS|nr:hypothetical protein RHSIM_Rhsim12G0060500 [Rhododendron simsii]